MVRLPLVEGFFLHEVRRGADPAVVVARDREGHELKRRQVRAPRLLAPLMPQSTVPERVLFRLVTEAGHPLTFAIAPAAGGTVCQVTRYRGAVSRGCGHDQRERVAPDEISVRPALWNEHADGKPLVTLRGVVGANVAALELRYATGETIDVPVVERFVLFEIRPAHHDDEWFVLVARDRRGNVIAQRSLGG